VRRRSGRISASESLSGINRGERGGPRRARRGTAQGVRLLTASGREEKKGNCSWLGVLPRRAGLSTREQFPKTPSSRSRPYSISLLFEIPALRPFSALSAVLRALRDLFPRGTRTPRWILPAPRESHDREHVLRMRPPIAELGCHAAAWCSKLPSIANWFARRDAHIRAGSRQRARDALPCPRDVDPAPRRLADRARTCSERSSYASRKERSHVYGICHRRDPCRRRWCGRQVARDRTARDLSEARGPEVSLARRCSRSARASRSCA